jgi:transposase
MVCIKPVMHIMNDRVTRTKRPRRVHDALFKRELVSRALQPGASVSAIALEAGINANLLFTWRRAHLDAIANPAPQTSAVLLPVTVATPVTEVAPPAAATMPRSGTGTIEIDIGNARIRLRGPVDEASVRCVVQALRDAQ